MRSLLNISIFLLFLSCQGQEQESGVKETANKSAVELYYESHAENDKESISKGSVSNGSLENGKLLSFMGDNFQYFDTSSYLGGRAFTSDKVKKTVLETYTGLAELIPDRQFCIMECSHEHGGKLFPHRTHQNGLSVDFMMPLKKDNKAYYELDHLGKEHYWLDFDNDGKYSKDPTVSIDFDLVAQHILLLDKNARANGLKIAKVIIKTELKDELYDSKYGEEFKSSAIYIVKSLTPMINSLHDEHFHIDFESL
jgi:penicillin-insensitive murein endopeptidase